MMGRYRFSAIVVVSVVAAVMMAQSAGAGIFINPSGKPIRLAEASGPVGGGAVPLTGATTGTIASENGLISLNVMNAEAGSLALAVGLSMVDNDQQTQTATLAELVGADDQVDPCEYLDAVWTFDLPEDAEAGAEPGEPAVLVMDMQPIPEPATLAMIGVGVLALIKRRG